MKEGMTVVSLTPLDLSLAALLVLLVGAVSVIMRLGVARSLYVAAARSTVQLLLVGLVLRWLFDSASPLWLLLVSGVMLAVAGREVIARQQRRFTGWWGYGAGTLSMFVSSFVVTLFALIVVIDNHPWYSPQYAIPLLGMLLGNTMNGISLVLDRLTQTAWQQRQVIEARLLLGQDWCEAIADIRRDATRSGLMPIINAMSVAGLVSLPGMMTGQILSGTPPFEAVKYQVLIMFLIATGTGFGTMVAVWLGARRLFDERSRLRLDRLRAPR